MYTLKKNGAIWEVRSASGRLQFQSLNKGNCQRWMAQNSGGNA